VHPHFELRDVEPEELDGPLERRDTRGDAPAAVRLQAAADDAEVVQQRGGRFVAIVREPPPHEGELAPVRLELVLLAYLRGVCRQLALVAHKRSLELLRHAYERPV